MTRRSRLSSVGLLTRHAGSGVIASLLVALLIAAAVLAVAVAPRLLGRLGTAELRHELGNESHALLDLTGTGQLGIVEGLPASSTVDDIVGASDEDIRDIRDHLPSPLRDHVGPVQWMVSTRADDADPPRPLPVKIALALGLDLDWMDRIRFVDGVAPTQWTGSEFVDPVPAGEPPVVQPPIPVAISVDAADKLQLRVGDVIGYRPAAVVVTGIYDLVDPDDAYWVHEINLARVTFETKEGELTTAHVIAYLAPESIASLQSAFAGGKLSAFLELDPTGLAYPDAEVLQTQVRQASAAQVALPYFGNLSFRSGLPDAVARVIQRVTSASALLALSVSGLLGVLLAVFALGVQSVIARRRPALALAAARGAGSFQLRASMVLEGVLLSVPGAAIAVGLAAVLVPIEVGLEGWVLPALVALAPPVLFGVMTSPRRLRDPRGDLQVRSHSRVRWVAEVAVVGLAALSLVLLTRRGLVASSEVVGIDPLLAATPLLLASAVCIGVLRVYPAPLLGLQRVLRGRRGSAGVLGAARAIRDPALGFTAALAMVVGISIVVFSVVMATTMRAGLVQGALDSIGADVQVQAENFTPSQVDEIASAPGVLGAAAVAMVTGVTMGIDSDDTHVLVVMADTAAMHEVRPDLPVLSEMVDGKIPVLVSSDWTDTVGGATLSLDGRDVHTAGVISAEAIPGAARHYLYLDSAFASQIGISASDPERVFVKLSPDALPTVAGDLDALVTASQPEAYRGLVVVTSARTLLAETRASPTVASLEGALLLAAAASLLLTMLTVILASVAAATARNRLVGVLRILGMSPRQLRAIQAWELGPVAITAVVVGTALGLVLPLIVTNALDLRPFVGGEIQPGAVVDPLWVIAAVGAFVLVVVLAGIVAAALGRRFAPAGTLKMGEG